MSDQTPPHRRRAARIVGIFLLTFVVGLAALRLSIPPRPDYVKRAVLGDKLEYLESTTTHYDVMILGNSRVHHGIDPIALDAELARQGCRVRSFNLAAPALTKLELDDVLGRLDDLPGGAPEVVVTADIAHLSVGLLRDFDVRHRVLFDPRVAISSYRYRKNLPQPYFSSSPLASIDVLLGFGAAQFPAGAAYQRLYTEVQPQEFGATLEHRGWASLSDLPAGQRAALRADLAQDIASGGFADRWRERTPDATQLRRWVDTIAAHTGAVSEGSRAVHALIPSEYDAGTAAAVAEAWKRDGDGTPLINLVDEREVPGFTRPGFWADPDHVTGDSARAISVALGRRLCPILRNQDRDH